CVGGILTGWNLSQNALFTKYKIFKQISTSFVIGAVFSLVFQTVFYFSGFLESGMIYGWILGLIISFSYNALVSKGSLRKIDIPLLKKSIHENLNIIKYSYTSNVLNTIANNILPILLFSYFTKLEVGVYGMAFTILSTPMVLVAGSISKVYFQKAYTLYNHDRKALSNLTYRVCLVSFAIILAFVLCINSFGIYILEMIFSGDEWVGLRNYLLILSIWILARSPINPIASIVLVINKNHYSLLFNVYLLVVNLIAIYIGVLNDNFEYCLYTFAILSSIGYLAQLAAIMIDLNKLVKNER